MTCGQVEENWAHSVDQCQLQAMQFSVHLTDLLSILLRCNGFAGIQKAVVDQMGSRPPNNDYNRFWVQVWLWEVLWSFLSVQPWSWLSYKIHFSSHIIIWSRNGSLLLHRIREDYALTWWFFLFSVSSWGTHLLSFFTSPICFKCRMAVEWLMLSSLATSHVVVRGSALMIALSWLLSTSNGQPLHSSSSKLCLLCKTSWTTTALFVC